MLGIDQRDHAARAIKFPEKSFPDKAFLQSVIAHFTGERSGDMGGHIFQGPLTETFNQLTTKPNYYPFHEDLELLREHAGFYGDLARPSGFKGPVTLIELGPGPSFEKTRELMAAIRPDHYMPIDKSMDALFVNAENMHREFPAISRHMKAINFYTQDPGNVEILHPSVQAKPGSELHKMEAISLYHAITPVDPLPAHGRRIIVQFGTTLGNMPGTINGQMPETEVLGALRHIRDTFMRPGDIAVFGIDMNQDPGSIRQCYRGKIHKVFAMATLDRIRDELDTSGRFQPEKFDYVQRWRKDSHLYSHCWRAKADMSFVIGDRPISLKEGTLTPYANCYRYPQSFLDPIYPKAGLERLEVFASSHKRMHHQVLKAV